jgi:hypothetical protein
MEDNNPAAKNNKKNFWDTITGTITKIAALLVAITGLIVALKSILNTKENNGSPGKAQTENSKPEKIYDSQNNSIVFLNGRLTSGLNMGVNSSDNQTGWVKIIDSSICMSYPANQIWGAVFITVGQPTHPPRPARNFSTYNQLVLELKGQKGGETVLIGVKDNEDPDDGSESKIRLNLTKEWAEYRINLRENFKTAELNKLYVVTEFVFEDKPQNICARKIQYSN